MKRLLASLFCAASLAGCDGLTDVACTLDVRPALEVTVVDDLSGERLRGMPLVIAIDGAFADTADIEIIRRYPPEALDTLLAPQTFWMAPERAGRYTVRVEHSQYEVWEKTGVRVTGSECHVRTVELEARLQPKPTATPPTVERDTTALVQTDSLIYRLEREWAGLRTTIRFSFTNPLPDTVYMVNCNGVVSGQLEKRSDGGQWIAMWSPVLPACLSPPVVIAPGATYEGTLPVWGALPGTNAAPQFNSSEVEGVYRMVWGSLVLHYDDSRQGFGDPVPLSVRISNAFVLDDPRNDG